MVRKVETSHRNPFVFIYSCIIFLVTFLSEKFPILYKFFKWIVRVFTGTSELFRLCSAAAKKSQIEIKSLGRPLVISNDVDKDDENTNNNDSTDDDEDNPLLKNGKEEAKIPVNFVTIAPSALETLRNPNSLKLNKGGFNSMPSLTIDSTQASLEENNLKGLKDTEYASSRGHLVVTQVNLIKNAHNMNFKTTLSRSFSSNAIQISTQKKNEAIHKQVEIKESKKIEDNSFLKSFNIPALDKINKKASQHKSKLIGNVSVSRIDDIDLTSKSNTSKFVKKYLKGVGKPNASHKRKSSIMFAAIESELGNVNTNDEIEDKIEDKIYDSDGNESESSRLIVHGQSNQVKSDDLSEASEISDHTFSPLETSESESDFDSGTDNEEQNMIDEFIAFKNAKVENKLNDLSERKTESYLIVDPKIVAKIEDCIYRSTKINFSKLKEYMIAGDIDEAVQFLSSQKWGFNSNVNGRSLEIGVLAHSLTLISSVEILLSDIEKKVNTAYDSKIPEHEAMLIQLWNNLCPGEKLENRFSKQWQKIGFQGKDPATDFRGMGILSLDMLLYFSKNHSKESRKCMIRAQEDEVSWFSWAIAGINIASLVFDLLKSRKISLYLYTFGPFENSIMDLFCLILHNFEKEWYKDRGTVTVMDFERRLKQYKVKVTEDLSNGKWLEF